MKRFRQVINLLKREKPPAFPVTVKRKPLSRFNGYCQRVDDSFKIVINSVLDEDRAIDILLHEFAHALSWSHLHDSLKGVEFYEKIHDAAWGTAYAEVYRVYEKFILKDVERPYYLDF